MSKPQIRAQSEWHDNVATAEFGLADLRALMEVATPLGVKVRISGASGEYGGLDNVSAAMRERLEAERDLVWVWLGGGEADGPALKLLWDEFDIDFQLASTPAEARDAVRQIERDKRMHGGVVALDTETAPRPGYGEPRPWARINKDGGVSARQPKITDRTALDPHCGHPALLSLYAGGPICHLFRDAALVLLVNSHWLRRQRLVMHNASFDLKFMRAATPNYRAPLNRRRRFRLDDTAQAAGLLFGIGFGGEARALDAVAKTVLGIELPKEIWQVSDWNARELSDGQLAYAACDAVVTWQLHPLLQRTLREEDRLGAYELQRGAIPATVEMELRGICLDREEHRRQSAAWAEELAAARREFLQLTGTAPPSTPEETRAWLGTVLTPAELEHWPHTPADDLLAVGAAQLKRLAHIESTHSVLRMLANQKLLTSFGPALVTQLNAATGRLHPHYAIAGAKTGRFSCNHPNLQQLPSRRAPAFRRCIIPAPGNILIGCDLNQIELRAAAWLSNDAALTAVFAAGRDVHRETAGFLLGLPVEQVSKEARQSAKAVSFGSLFGQQAPGLVEYAFDAYDLVLTEQAAAQALQRFALAYPALDDWKRRNYRLCKQLGYVEIGCGRVVKAIWEYENRIRFAQACNFPIQGICADAMLRAVRLVHGRLLAARIRGGLVATVHDELLCEVAEADAEQARGILQAAMLEAFSTTFPGAPSVGVAVATIGCNWAELKS